MDKIVTTSGFCIPANQYFTPFSKDNSIADDIFNRALTMSDDYKLAKYFTDNGVHNSTAVTNLYLEYRRDPSFDNFCHLVETASEIFKLCDFADFISWQVANPYVTDTSLMFCSDLIQGNLLKLQSYVNVPCGARFHMDNSLTTSKMRSTIQKLNEDCRQSGYLFQNSPTWVNLFERLTVDHNLFVAFYRYVLCDRY